MEKHFHLSVLTSESTVFDGEVEYVNLPIPSGSLGVLARHAPMLCAVERGILRCTSAGGDPLRIAVGTGVASVADGEMTVLVSAAELQKDE